MYTQRSFHLVGREEPTSDILKKWCQPYNVDATHKYQLPAAYFSNTFLKLMFMHLGNSCEFGVTLHWGEAQDITLYKVWKANSLF
jgi:hypothetical protein